MQICVYLYSQNWGKTGLKLGVFRSFFSGGKDGGRPVHRTATYKCDDNRGCIIQFWPPNDEYMMLETRRGMK